MNTTLKKVAVVTYGAVAYMSFAAALFYLMGFLVNVGVPKGIDTGATGPLVPSLAIDIALVALFGLQHTVMARPGFKEVWTKLVPKPIERSTYVIATFLVMALMFWQWRPIPTVVWRLDSTAGQAVMQLLYLGGYAIVALATFMINHFDLFGLRQVYLHARGERYRPLPFQTKGFYNYARHPLMAGWILTFWATPVMTVGHVVFAAAATGYILIALVYEERDLIRFHGHRYEDYKRQVNAFLPLRKFRAPSPELAPTTAAGAIPSFEPICDAPSHSPRP